MTRRYSSGVIWWTGAKTDTIASLTQMSMVPHSDATRSAAAATALASETSSGMIIGMPPAARISHAAPSSPAKSRAISATRARSAPNARAMARPTPLDAPVITTTLSSSLTFARANRLPPTR
jgi:hypothetical protein